MQEYNTDDDYKQLYSSYNSINHQNDVFIKINLVNRCYLCIFILLILISQSNSFPIQQQQQPTYKIYRSNSPNAAIVQIHNPANTSNQQPLKRERYRRKMIDRLFLLFDEDLDGHLSKDEFYSFSLRLNIFPKVHHFLKKAA